MAAATILGGVYALCIWRFRTGSYSRLSESVPGSTEKLITSTEVSIYESREEGGLRNNNEQSRIDAAERKEEAVGKDQPQVAGHGKKDVESTSESTESSEVGDHESRPLLSGGGPKEAAKYGIASHKAKHEAQLHTAAPTLHSDDIHAPTKEKSTAGRGGLGFDDTSAETAGEQAAKSLEISTVADTTTTTPLLSAALSETTEQQKPPVPQEKDEPADVSNEIAAEKPQKLEPLIDLTSGDGDGGAGTLLLPAQTSEVQAVKSGFTDSSSSQIVESEKSLPSVNTSTGALITTEGAAASKEPNIADKLNALFQPKLHKETEDLNEHTQTFPPMTRSPLPAVLHIAPKPAPRKSRPTSDSSPRPVSSASPGGALPPVAAKPIGKARKQVFSSPSAVPVLPMPFGKGGFVPPALRRKAEVSNSTGDEDQTGGRLPPMGAMFIGGGFGARPGSEGAGVEEPTSFDEVRQFIIRVDITEREGGRERGEGRESRCVAPLAAVRYYESVCSLVSKSPEHCCLL